MPSAMPLPCSPPSDAREQLGTVIASAVGPRDALMRSETSHARQEADDVDVLGHRGARATPALGGAFGGAFGATTCRWFDRSAWGALIVTGGRADSGHPRRSGPTHDQDTATQVTSSNGTSVPDKDLQQPPKVALTCDDVRARRDSNPQPSDP